MRIPPTAVAGATYGDWADHIATLERAGRGPSLAIMRATLDGTIHTVLGQDPAEPPDLPGLFMPGKPVLWIVSANSTGPDEWRVLPEMQLWGSWAAVHAVRPTLLHYEIAIEAALQLNRAVFVETSPQHAPAWARALAPILCARPGY